MPVIPISEMKLDQLKIRIPVGISDNFIKSFKSNKIGNTAFSDVNPTVDKLNEYIEKYYSIDLKIISVYHKTVKEKTHKDFSNTKEIIEILSIDYDAQRGTSTNLVMEFDVNHKLTVSYEWKSPNNETSTRVISQDFLRFNQDVTSFGVIDNSPYYLHAKTINNLFEIIENFLGENIIDWTNGKISYLNDT